jgi:hypothetical protein
LRKLKHFKYLDLSPFYPSLVFFYTQNKNHSSALLFAHCACRFVFHRRHCTNTPCCSFLFGKDLLLCGNPLRGQLLLMKAAAMTRRTVGHKPVLAKDSQCCGFFNGFEDLKKFGVHCERICFARTGGNNDSILSYICTLLR